MAAYAEYIAHKNGKLGSAGQLPDVRRSDSLRKKMSQVSRRSGRLEIKHSSK